MTMRPYYADIDLATVDASALDALAHVVGVFRSANTKFNRTYYRPETTRPYALRRVSPLALPTDRSPADDVPNARDDSNILMLSESEVDVPGRALCSILPSGVRRFAVSGLILYPPLGFMGWHTNSNHQALGSRAYFAHVSQGHRSFFRYRHPVTRKVITSWDRVGWNVRLFRVDGKPLWHCVYAGTRRCSIGLAVDFGHGTPGA